MHELLAAGIDVYPTVHVGTSEPRDIVGSITSIKVRETLPDRVLTTPTIVLVDLTPDDLLKRLKAGSLPSRRRAVRTSFARATCSRCVSSPAAHGSRRHPDANLSRRERRACSRLEDARWSWSASGPIATTSRLCAAALAAARASRRAVTSGAALARCGLAKDNPRGLKLAEGSARRQLGARPGRTRRLWHAQPQAPRPRTRNGRQAARTLAPGANWRTAPAPTSTSCDRSRIRAGRRT